MEQEYPGCCLGHYDADAAECGACMIREECKQETDGDGSGSVDAAAGA